MPRASAKRLDLLASLVCFLASHQQRLGDGAPLEDVLRVFSLTLAQLRMILKSFSRLGISEDTMAPEDGVDAYIEGGRVHLYGPLTRMVARDLSPDEKAVLQAAAGLFAGSVSKPEAKRLRGFARQGPRLRAVSASKDAMVGLRALAEDRILVQKSNGEKFLPLYVVWYQGQPCLEVAVLYPLPTRGPASPKRRRLTRLFRLDRFPTCRLMGPAASREIPQKRLTGLAHRAGGFRARLVLSGEAQRRILGNGRGSIIPLEAESPEDLIRRVLRFGSDARVLAPTWLRLALKKRADEAVKLYGPRPGTQ